MLILQERLLAYKVSTHTPFKKNISNIQKQNQEKILDCCDEIQKDPSIGESMSGSFNALGFKSYKIKDTNPQYRILYKVYKCNKSDKNKVHFCFFKEIHSKDELLNCDGLVDFIITGSREFFNNFYKKSAKELKAYLK